MGVCSQHCFDVFNQKQLGGEEEEEKEEEEE